MTDPARETIRQTLRDRYHGAIEPTDAMIDAVAAELAPPTLRDALIAEAKRQGVYREDTP